MTETNDNMMKNLSNITQMFCSNFGLFFFYNKIIFYGFFKWRTYSENT